ncbi:radical SAM protein [Streptomyces sp. NBC_00378]|uniref:radical SAM protein n=1 Tax=unclassified Streptomyces TaxID=2593676 RepID=UPI0022590CC4|nr:MULTISPECIES: radical SAM protein [unclassified Streptomyces]MCX5111856.1 radical SAM protein [Streptomyces sp. NBC_00378]
MELAELIGLRPVPAGGVLVTLTRRCPLRCAHCSTGSGPEVREEPEADALERFVSSFTAADRPEVMMLTGGEPLLRPGLVTSLARSARAAGTRTALLSGMFFARSGGLPDPVRRAVRTLDHFSASLDLPHEREVPRAAVFRAVREIRELGVAVSFHLTGTGADDGYLADVTADIDRAFNGTVPSLVNEVRPFGRAASWARPARTVPDGEGALPCAMAAWPVVAFDGTVLACCNQDAVDHRPVPPHLRLGHVAQDDWPAVRSRTLGSPLLRLVRTVGPAHLRQRWSPGTPAGSYCGDCRRLGGLPEVVAAADALASGAAGALLDLTAARRQHEQGPVSLVRRHGCAAYAGLVAAPGGGRNPRPATEGAGS